MPKLGRATLAGWLALAHRTQGRQALFGLQRNRAPVHRRRHAAFTVGPTRLEQAVNLFLAAVVHCHHRQVPQLGAANARQHMTVLANQRRIAIDRRDRLGRQALHALTAIAVDRIAGVVGLGHRGPANFQTAGRIARVERGNAYRKRRGQQPVVFDLAVVGQAQRAGCGGRGPVTGDPEPGVETVNVR